HYVSHTPLHSSPTRRSSDLRSAVALSLSIAVAKSVSLQHPFWIVLGTLSALRFDALGTGRTAKQALIGTTAGVALSAVCIQIIGDRKSTRLNSSHVKISYAV